ncbi:PP2C family protein-serine/threonine phosphatase [Planctomycetota bacterium]
MVICDKKPTILVVDDDATNILVLESMLKKEGYRTLRANNGREAMDVAQIDQPDLILLDIMMPEIDGFQACRNLQQDSRTTDIPVIFLSALDEVDSKVKAFDIGAVDYVGKPFHKAEVLARVRLHLKLNLSRYQALAVQTEKLQQLHDAQQSILVTPEDIPNAKFGVSYSPLHEAGGDFYDVLTISDDIFGYFVADISGHDVRASFATPAIKVLLAQHASPVFTAVETVKNVNGILNTVMGEGDHVTASYVRLNRAARVLELVNAGHPPVLFVANDGAVEYLETPGDVLGVFENVCFETIERNVCSGDRFYLFSDGMIERFCLDRRARREGMDELAEVVLKRADLPIRDAVTQIYHDVFQDETLLEDDIVLMGVEV